MEKQIGIVRDIEIRITVSQEWIDQMNDHAYEATDGNCDSIDYLEHCIQNGLNRGSVPAKVESIQYAS